MFSMSPVSRSEEETANAFRDRSSEAYADLLRDIASLKSDLLLSKESEVRLANENQSLRTLHHQSTTELVEVRTRLEESKNALQGQIRSTCIREKELGSLESKWGARVEQERKEIENERKEILENSITLERMRMEVVDEVQKEMSGEMKNANDKVRQVHRDFELYKAKHITSLENALRSAKTAHEAREKDAVTFALSRGKLAEAEKTSSQKIRELALESRECRLRMKQMSQVEDQLRMELREALGEKIGTEASLVEAESRHAMKVKEVQAKNVLVETEAQVLRGKVNTLQGDHNELNLTINDIKQKLSQVELSLKEMQRATDEKERHIKDLTEDARIEKERLQKYAKTQQSMLKKEVHMIMEQKRNIEVELEESHMSFQTFRRDAITAEERNQREFQLALNELVVKNATLEETTTTLQNDLLLKEMESECSIQNLKQALEMCQQEARKTMKVKQSLQSEVKLLEEISKSLKDELLEARRKLEHLVDECNKKELELDESDTKIRDLTVYHDLILSQLDAQTKELSKERMTTKRAEKEARESAEKSDALVQKEKRKTDAFKQKALEAQALNVHTKQLLKKMSNEAN